MCLRITTPLQSPLLILQRRPSPSRPALSPTVPAGLTLDASASSAKILAAKKLGLVGGFFPSSPASLSLSYDGKINCSVKPDRWEIKAQGGGTATKGRSCEAWSGQSLVDFLERLASWSHVLAGSAEA